MPQASSKKQARKLGALYSQGKISKAALSRKTKGLNLRKLPTYSKKKRKRK